LGCCSPSRNTGCTKVARSASISRGKMHGLLFVLCTSPASNSIAPASAIMQGPQDTAVLGSVSELSSDNAQCRRVRTCEPHVTRQGFAFRVQLSRYHGTPAQLRLAESDHLPRGASFSHVGSKPQNEGGFTGVANHCCIVIYA
jgi:hypothetical protein